MEKTIRPIDASREGQSDSLLQNNGIRLSLRKKLFFSIVACLLILAMLELGLRTAQGWHRHWLDCHRWHPVLGWSLREDWAGKWSWTGGYSRINAQGIRDDDPVAGKKIEEKRLLVLGDSVTFGAGVTTHEAYPYQLEQALRKAGLQWRVLNGGVTAYDPSQEADWLELFGWPLEPDALAIGFCRNDWQPSARANGKADDTTGAMSRWLTEHSIIAYKMQRSLWRLAATTGQLSPTAIESQTALKGWPLIEQSYRRIARQAQERGTPVILFVFPTRDDLEGNIKDNFSRRFERLGKQLGWQVIDLGPALADDPASFFPPQDPVHPNPAGYLRAADAIANAIVAGRWLP